MRTWLSTTLAFGLFAASGAAWAGPLPEPTAGIPQDKSVARRVETPPTIDGDLSDWEGAVFKLIGRQQDVFRGEWTGPDDLTCTWSARWDDTTFYFAAAIRDDVLVAATGSDQPWTGDAIFLYIDANADGTIDNKPCFFLFDGKPAVLGMAGGAESGTVELAIVMEPQLGKAGRILEAAVPLDCLTNMRPTEGGIFRMTPGYEEGTQGAEIPATFLDWDGLDPDIAANLRQVIFGGVADADSWAMARAPNPPDGEKALFMPLLRWTPGDGATLHNVYVGKSPDLGPADLAGSRLTLAMYYHTSFPLEPGVTYYWRVDEIAKDGQTIHTGTVWSFTTQALTAYLPSPANGDQEASLATTLTWAPGKNAPQHHLYFSTNPDAVTQGTAEADKGIMTETTFDPNSLEPATTYYWRVDELLGGNAIQTGPVWTFTTFLPVDDFESYTDDEGSRIYQTWIDGFSDGSSGSTVGYVDAPFAERKTVHGGLQAMPLDYNNIDAPFFSEAERQFEPAQDWTVHDVNMLVLYFRGRTLNSPDRLYVALEDASRNRAVVDFPEADKSVVAARWTAWRIPLSEFAGVDPARIQKMSVGLRARDDQGPGGTGLIYVDDIRLIRGSGRM